MPGVTRRKCDLLIAADTFESYGENITTGNNNPVLESALPGQIHSRQGLRSYSSLGSNTFCVVRLPGEEKPNKTNLFSEQSLSGGISNDHDD